MISGVSHSHPYAHPHAARAYGVLWSSPRPLPGFSPVPADATQPPDIQVRFPTEPAPARLLRQRGKHLWRASDGMRYLGPDGLALDTYGGDRIEAYGIAPDREPPLPFYGTITALLLAWRGLVPLHGCSVLWNGGALLLCGPSGAGKSSLTAALLARGAALLSDDLSALHGPGPLCPKPHLFSGRRTLRLFPAVSAALGQTMPLTDPVAAPGGKLACQLPVADPAEPVPLRGLILLEPALPESTSPQPGDASRALALHLYRPRALQEIPGVLRRQAILAFAAQSVPAVRFGSRPLQTAADLRGAGEQLIHALSRAGL